MEKEVKYCLPCDTTNTPKKQRKRELCIYEGCKTIRLYNFKGETNALYCFTHKLDGMIDVKNKTCIYEGCNVNPIYNFKGKTKRLYCAKHKLEGMINIKHKPCIYEGCEVRPTYNYECNTKPVYCVNHKLEGMISVCHNFCNYHNCKIRPLYNFEGEKKSLYCASHKLDGMIDIMNKRCIYKGCRTIPTYNFEGKIRRLYCSTHKLDGMVSQIKHEICKTYLCNTRVQQKYDGYCQFCYVNMFPDNPLSRNYKTKEYSVVDFVKLTFPHYDWIADKKIEGGCSKRRPDLLLDLGYQIIVIEIDENQHIDYDCSCENKRIMELSLDVGHRPIVFIRFNPDDYLNGNNNVTSCWGLNKKGLCIVKKNKKDEWNQRLNSLANQISYWINPNNKIDKTVEIIQLYYDI